MKHILLVFLLTFCISLCAQDTIPVQTTYKDGAKNEIYFVNKSGNKVGKYARYTRYGKVYVEGQYDNGNPIGIWNYYTADTSGQLVETLNFDTHKEVFVDTVRAQGLICGPRYFGGNSAKQEYIQLRIKNDFTDQEKAMMKGKSVLAVFEVDQKTFTTYAVSIEDNALPDDIRKKISRIITEMPAWLRPLCPGGTPVWRMSVVFVF